MRLATLRGLVVGALAGAVLVSSPATALAGGRTLTTSLTGAEEVPGPGDEDATGRARITLNQGSGTVCFRLAWAEVDGTVVAAHIHEAPAGEAGDVVVTLIEGEYAGTDVQSGCITGVERALIKDIRKNPADYYINVHSTEFPKGAVRGQLG